MLHRDFRLIASPNRTLNCRFRLDFKGGKPICVHCELTPIQWSPVRLQLVGGPTVWCCSGHTVWTLGQRWHNGQRSAACVAQGRSRLEAGDLA
jgi:hypothetical protein